MGDFWRRMKGQLLFINIMRKSHEICFVATVRQGCKGKNILHNHESWLQTMFFPKETVTDGCKVANFLGFSHEYAILDTIFWKVSQKMWILLKNSLKLTFFQLSWLQRGNILCNHDSWLQSHNNWLNTVTFENLDYSMNLAKSGQYHF